MRASIRFALLLSFLAACGKNDHADAGPDASTDAGGGDADADVDAAPADLGTDAPTCFLDGGPFPTPVAGHCSAVVDPSALAKVGPDGTGGFIVPDGRRVSLSDVGTRIPLTAGFPMRSMIVPGTHFAVITDGGISDEHLIVIDLDTATVVDDEPFLEHSAHEALFLGMASSGSGATRRLWLSGGGSNHVFAYDMDTTTGALTAVPASDVTVDRPTSMQGYVAGLGLLPDGHTIVAAMLLGQQVVWLDSATGAEVGAITFVLDYPYDLALSPDGSKSYVSLWGGHAVQVVDNTTHTLGTRIMVGKNPEGLAMSPDGTTLAVADADTDEISLVDIVTETVTSTIPLHAPGAPNDASPTHLAFDGPDRLYVVTANENAVDVFERTGASAPFMLAGRLPTAWYPTDVQVRGDGSLVVCNGKDDSTGPNVDPAMNDITDLQRGSVTLIPAPDAASLATATTEVETNNARMSHFVSVQCDPGTTTSDFPIPRPGEGPSTKIQHVIVIMRENKTYDAYLGDLAGHDGMPLGDGDPTLTFFPPAMMDMVLPNTRELARTFAVEDNYYGDAEQSTQGHFWNVTGRDTDFNERQWLTSSGRGYWTAPASAVLDDIGYPAEGSFFEYLSRESVPFVVWGEITGTSRTTGPMGGYPGFVFTLDVADHDRAVFLARQWQTRCNLPAYTFALFPRDHTYGLGGGHPTPATMISDNDEAVGIAAEALSHSTWWPTSLIIVMEDDPQEGGDHVDNHRIPFLAISPWVKRGYASHVHVNESSILKTVQLILGLTDSFNGELDDVAPLYDLFTSTPDYTPYTHLPRMVPDAVNPSGTAADAEARSAHWDFSRPDDQPGLSRHLYRWLRGTEPPWRATPAPRDPD